MPTYEYKCDKCDDVYEVRQSFHDDPITDCPSGDGGSVKKVFGNVGIVFKGSGFYKTDSRSSSKKSSGSSATSSSSSSSDSPKSDGPKSDSAKSDSPKSTKKGDSSASSSSGSSTSAA